MGLWQVSMWKACSQSCGAGSNSRALRGKSSSFCKAVSRGTTRQGAFIPRALYCLQWWNGSIWLEVSVYNCLSYNVTRKKNFFFPRRESDSYWIAHRQGNNRFYAKRFRNVREVVFRANQFCKWMWYIVLDKGCKPSCSDDSHGKM